MTSRALDVFVGQTARRRLAERGWDAEIFSLLLGASGGPKWLVLSQLDRVLFGDFLSRRQTPLHVLGTSIGSWRHACLAQKDPVAAIARLEEAYIRQSYGARPSAREVSSVSRSILKHALGDEGVVSLLGNTKIRTHVGTARGRGLLASSQPFVQAGGLGAAMLANAVARRWLEPWYQRVIFSSDPEQSSGMIFEDFATVVAQLSTANTFKALLASGSIPLVLEGISDPEGAPPGQYWDGGVIDYHHDLSAYQGEGLVLFPHFFSYIIPGWFDKSRQRRRPTREMLDKVVLLTASKSFVAQLPGGKIPDRKDFEHLGNEERIERWWQVTRQCEALADELGDLFSQADPVASVKSF